MNLRNLFHRPLREAFSAVFFAGGKREEMTAELEEQLVLADISIEVARRVVREASRRVENGGDKEEWLERISEQFLQIISCGKPLAFPGSGKEVLLLVGVNGSGKTTTAAKLAQWYRSRGREVMLCAADTFRAAGSTQLEIWGERLGIPVIDGQRGTDPGAVVFRAMQKLTAGSADLLIVDTAGRVQSKDHLMRELEKIRKIISKNLTEQPAESWLVLDAATGQNAMMQAEKFKEFSGITGLVLAKIDGSAKGGMVVSIADRQGLPVRFLGVGESESDLLEFSCPDFVDALLGA